MRWDDGRENDGSVCLSRSATGLILTWKAGGDWATFGIPLKRSKGCCKLFQRNSSPSIEELVGSFGDLRRIPVYGLRFGPALKYLNLKNLAQALPLLSPNVTALHLDWAFEKFRVADLVRIFKALPAAVTHVWTGKMPKLKLKDWVSFLGFLTTIRYLNLANNGLAQFNTDDLISIIRAIPGNVTHLKLSGNNLNSLTAADLRRVLTALPQSVIHLDLSDNGLELGFPRELRERIDVLRRAQQPGREILVFPQFDRELQEIVLAAPAEQAAKIEALVESVGDYQRQREEDCRQMSALLYGK